MTGRPARFQAVMPPPMCAALSVPAATRCAFSDAWVYGVIDGRQFLAPHGPRNLPVWGVELWRELGTDVEAGQKTRDLIGGLVDYLKTLQLKATLGNCN